MRLKLFLAVAAAAVGTSSAIYELVPDYLAFDTAALVPLLTQIPYVDQLLELTEQLGLPSLLETLPEQLFTRDQFWQKVGFGLAGTGVGIIEVRKLRG